MGTKTVNEASFQYSFGSNDKEMQFSFGMPYQEKNLHEFIAGHTKHPNLNIRTLCQTRKARKTERLHLGCVDGKAKHRVLITCRHHCCEMMASYSLEGIMEAILSDTDEGRWFGGNVEFLIIPFMDKDGVEDGDQGKNRAPHDHGRDYVGSSIYSSVKTLREFVPKWSEGKLEIALDLHCPHIRGLCNEKIYLVGLESQDIWQEQCVFSEILESVQTGPLVFRAKDNLPYGQEWNKGENWADGKSFPQWAVNLPGIKLTSAIEIPYANAGGKEVTAETAKRFGYDFARAVRTYIETT